MAEKIVKDSQGLAKDLVNDCISRQAAIDALNKLDVSDGVGISSVACDLQEEAIRSIENLPSAQPYTDEEIQKMQDIEQAQLYKAYEMGNADALPWIPCSERLPEHGRRYLISVLDGINRRTTVAPYLPRCKAWTMTGRMAYWKVIAWMPLPEPYREDGHD